MSDIELANKREDCFYGQFVIVDYVRVAQSTHLAASARNNETDAPSRLFIPLFCSFWLARYYSADCIPMSGCTGLSVTQSPLRRMSMLVVTTSSASLACFHLLQFIPGYRQNDKYYTSKDQHTSTAWRNRRSSRRRPSSPPTSAGCRWVALCLLLPSL